MYYVYLIRSIRFPEKTYIGFTSNLKRRLAAHNSGESKHTTKFLPWGLISAHGFSDRRKAKEFEYYLKTGSGQAFAKKRLW